MGQSNLKWSFKRVYRARRVFSVSPIGLVACASEETPKIIVGVSSFQVTFEPSTLVYPSQSSTSDGGEPLTQPGIITYSIDAVKQTINFYPVEGKKTPQVGDRVSLEGKGFVNVTFLIKVSDICAHEN